VTLHAGESIQYIIGLAKIGERLARDTVVLALELRRVRPHQVPRAARAGVLYDRRRSDRIAGENAKKNGESIEAMLLAI